MVFKIKIMNNFYFTHNFCKGDGEKGAPGSAECSLLPPPARSSSFPRETVLGRPLSAAGVRGVSSQGNRLGPLRTGADHHCLQLGPPGGAQTHRSVPRTPSPLRSSFRSKNTPAAFCIVQETGNHVIAREWRIGGTTGTAVCLHAHTRTWVWDIPSEEARCRAPRMIRCFHKKTLDT